MNQPQLYCLNEGATIIMPQVVLNEVASIRLPLSASIRLSLQQPQEYVLTLLGILIFWFHTQPDWFLKRA
jgi:hypothetical protein